MSDIMSMERARTILLDNVAFNNTITEDTRDALVAATTVLNDIIDGKETLYTVADVKNVIEKAQNMGEIDTEGAKTIEALFMGLAMGRPS